MADRLDDLRSRLAGVGGQDARIVAVTKGFGIDAVDAAVAAGLTDIGESYAQETVGKLASRAGAPTVHFIGRLQRNKVRRLCGLVDVWQSVDRPSLVDEIARRAPGAAVMLQVDISAEEQKGGCAVAEVDALRAHADDAGLDVRGLMGVGPIGDAEDSRPGFRLLRTLVDEHALTECSMGMSADIEVAIEEGATMIRVGSALFGPRPPRGSVES